MAPKMLKNVVNLDANESIFFARELQHIKAKTYDVVYPDLMCRQVIPVSMDAGEGAAFIVYRQYDMVGQAKVISNYSKDLPRVDLRAKEFIANVRSIGDAYGYSVQEIRSAKMAGIPLDQRKANAAKRAALQTEEQIALNGDTDNGLGGFITNPNLTDVAAPNGAASTPQWSTKTANEILADLMTLATTAPVATLNVEQPDSLILPVAQNARISTLQMPNINVTVKEFFLKNNDFIKNIIVWPRFAGAGAGGSDLAMSFKKDPEKVELQIPVDFEQFPVQEKGLEYEVPCHMRNGGVIWYYPVSGTKMHNI